MPLQFVSLCDGREIFVWSDCLLDLGMDFLVGNMVFVWDAYYLAVAPHFHGLYSSLELCCEGPWFTSIQEDGCDKGAHQSYFGTKRNTLVNPNWFQPCQCCCCLCYPGEYLRLGTLISYNWAQVLEACNCLKLLSIHFDLCVDAIQKLMTWTVWWMWLYKNSWRVWWMWHYKNSWYVECDEWDATRTLMTWRVW